MLPCASVVKRFKAVNCYKKFYLIGQLAVITSVFYTSIDSPWNTFQEFPEHTKENPGVKYGHPGIGTTIFLRTENFKKIFGART
jgi:tripartite-type tricarboxylate transporter receptor subunit TctC